MVRRISPAMVKHQKDIGQSQREGAPPFLIFRYESQAQDGRSKSSLSHAPVTTQLARVRLDLLLGPLGHNASSPSRSQEHLKTNASAFPVSRQCRSQAPERRERTSSTMWTGCPTT